MVLGDVVKMVYVSSIKSMMGYFLGVVGGIEGIVILNVL